ncbi:MAG: hypothetical protein IPO81_19220 [Kouleothrix sp.]|nr:hypothetical protein [Kouleothrix sp.]
MHTLATIVAELLRTARRSREDRHADLPKGARLAVRVEPLDESSEQITLTLARRNAHVGTAEEQAFRQACGVPADALRERADELARRN